MLTSYFKSAYRNLMRRKISSLINVVGLSIGISASLVIYTIVHYEFSFDKFHRDGDRIYRIVTKMDFPDMTFYGPGVPIPTAKAVKEEMTGVELATHIVTAHGPNVTVEEPGSTKQNVFKNQKEVVYADTNYFRFFDYHWLAGSAAIALAQPFQVVLTESRARLYFPNILPVDAISRRITYDDSIGVKVSGIVKDLDEVTDFRFCEFISMGTIEQSGLKDQWQWQNWGSTSSASQLFVKLMPGIVPKDIERQLIDMRNHHRETQDQKDPTQHFLQPLSEIHFNALYGSFDNRSQGNKSVLYGLLAVAAFLLFLGSINFINLATAQAALKAKEIGIRKTLGSSRMQLMIQFLGESFLLTLVAAILSIAIAQLLLDVFKSFIPEGISAGAVLQPHVWIFLGILTFGVSLLSGLYPAFVLTRFQPISILRNQAFAGTSTTRSAVLRKTLTVTQFTIAQFLIIATIVVSKQVLFSLNMDLGYRRDAIVWFRVPWGLPRGQWGSSLPAEDRRRYTLVERLRQIPEITNVSLGGNPPASSSTSTNDIKVNTGKKVVETMVEMKEADPNYFDLYGIRLIAGRNLVESDTSKEYVINETYAKFLGFANPRDAIGHVMESNTSLPIVGVIADFHTKSTHVAIKPLAYSAASRRSYIVHLGLNRADPLSWKRAIDKTGIIYRDIFPDRDFDPKFFDESIAAFYAKEQNTSLLLRWAAGLAIFISSLGVLGLAIHTTNSRTKEIGVRKVLGASVTGIVALLSKEFLALILVAFLLAAPVGWWAMHGWLQEFVYRTTLSWWVFFLTGILAILTALLTVGIQAIRAATANPVESLRYE